jgi:hypothetical protein
VGGILVLTLTISIFPKCKGRLHHHPILGPLFGDCAHPGALPYMVNTVDLERKRKETNIGV